MLIDLDQMRDTVGRHRAAAVQQSLHGSTSKFVRIANYLVDVATYVDFFRWSRWS
jgi:hypothetical protein